MEVNRDTLIKYFSGTLSESESSAIIAWARSSEDNLSILNSERKLYDYSILSDYQPMHKNRKAVRISFVRTAVSIVAALALVSISALVLYNKNKQDDLTAYSIVSAPAGARSLITLPDGSEVWLNSESSIKYDNTFGISSTREVHIDGQARFDVAKDTEHPFIVHTNIADIKVTGTTFDVRAFEAEGKFEAVLFSGRIQVTLSDEPDKTYTLEPSQKISLDDDNLIIENVEEYDTYRWIDGLYCFKEKPFSEILEDMKRYYDVKIVTDISSETAGKKLTGKFQISDGLDYALNILKLSFDFNYSINEITDEIIISN